MYTPKSFLNGGGFSDWFSRKIQRPSYTLEISKYYTETNPPISEFWGAWRENQGVPLFAGYESAKLYQARMDVKTTAIKQKLFLLME